MATEPGDPALGGRAADALDPPAAPAAYADPGASGNPVADAGSSAATDAVLLEDRYRLFSGRPLPEFSSPNATAFAVQDETRPQISLFGIVLQSVAPRLPEMRTLAASPPAGLLRIAAFGIVDWEPLRRRALAVAFEAPGGERLSLETPRMSPSELVQRVLWPVARTLRELGELGVTHRGIRLENLYWTDARGSSVVLGECVSAPPGSDQGIAYETVANGGAHPAGRSEGSLADDLYALGVTALALTQQKRIWLEMPPRTLLNRKLEFGSASALIGSDPPPPELLPVLRGLLCDDPGGRWSLDDLEAWLRQERIPHHTYGNSGLPGKTLRIGRETYKTRAAAAAGMAADVRSGAAAIRSGVVTDWVQSNLRDSATAAAITNVSRISERFSARARDSEDLLVARVGMLLDPEGPIRYRTISVMPDSIGPLLATLCAEPESNRESIRDIVGLVRGDLLAGARAGARSWATSERLDALQFALFTGLGGGIERTIYALNPEMPCLSPMVSAAYPTRLKTLLKQLEIVARTADFHTSPLDTHSAAFLAQHAGIGRHALGALLGRAPHQGERAIVELRLLSAAQAAAGGMSLPLLTNWMANRTSGLANGIRNRPLRKRISALLGNARESGQLSELLRLLDSAKMWEDDERGFERARDLHRRAGLQAVRLRNEMGAAMRQALERGREAAAATAAFSAFAIVALALLMRTV